MTMRHSAASLLAAFALGAGSAQACTTPDACPPGSAPVYAPMEPAASTAETAAAPAPAPGTPLRLHAPTRKSSSRKAEPRRAAAQAEKAERADQVLLPRPRPDTDGGWPAGAYAMEPARPEAPPVAESSAAPDGVSVADAGQLKEADRIADGVRVVSAEELNEIDLAAPASPAAETTGRADPATPRTADARTAPEPMPASWIAGLVVAFGGAAAAASALFIRQARTTR